MLTLEAMPATVIESVPTERRGPDRRQCPTPILSRYSLLGGRRRRARRATENEGAIVDQHGVGLLTVALLIVVLNVLDAWLTLLLLSHGGRELNPFAQMMLDWSIHGFLWFKSLGIGLCTGFLVLTKNFRAARLGLGAVLTGYFLLLVWHFYLLACMLD